MVFDREFVVDLVGEPGNVHGPDSSINGSLLFSVPSPFKISLLQEFQQPYMDNVFSQILRSKQTCAPGEKPLYSGMLFFAYPCYSIFICMWTEGLMIEFKCIDDYK